MIDKVKRAKYLREQGVKNEDITSDTGLNKNYITVLIELYDEMSQMQQVDDKNSDYVRIKKKRYLMKSIKLQHKLADIRKEYLRQLEVLKKKRQKVREYIDQAEEISDLKKEIMYKQKMLSVTGTNLQHAEDGYEYLKQEVKYNYAFWFIMGISFTFAVLLAFKYLGHYKFF
ncbi:hypothetical protein LCX93_06500 [Sulfurimonas sp. SWIR-19]|uniref:hypothetical protein n=1 Tax=Sulfurimonas sp. SWIR-19 TaxID=2878390 RepID=UPI001CF48A89|nr:hypothetical protein [Sulfurimonas sp. SWIR-19]UCM99190.1 hypothetical protein LCX93_06500 [Sulfurimonas sp. SWIR-19]